ncbi:MAG: metal ABC transporter ATP-binding protein [Spirochaetaceae bacterium]|nr:metal ABC transporter ATP-binding protein [Spirochaetaceae bacterium]
MNGSCTTFINNLSLYEHGKVILKDVSLRLHCGAISALVGPNGAGKSSLLRSLIGEVKHSGQITFNGKKNLPRIGYVPQKLAFGHDNPCNVLDLFLLTYHKMPIFLLNSKKCRPKVEEALSKVAAAGLIDRPLEALSGGELRRVFLALALMNEPELLLLDEPSTGLDKNGSELFYQLIALVQKEYHLSILMVSHDFNLVKQYANYVFLLNDGRLINEGKPEQLFKSDEFNKLFGKAVP